MSSNDAAMFPPIIISYQGAGTGKERLHSVWGTEGEHLHHAQRLGTCDSTQIHMFDLDLREAVQASIPCLGLYVQARRRIATAWVWRGFALIVSMPIGCIYFL